MADQADGSIIIDAELNSDGFKAGSSELLAAIKSLSQEVKTLGETLLKTFSSGEVGQATQDAGSQMGSLQERVKELETALEELKNQKVEPTVDPNAEARMKEMETTISQLREQLKGVSAQTTEPELDTSQAEAKITDLEAKIQEMENRLASMGADGQTVSPTVNFDGATKSTSSLERQIDSLRGKVENLEPTFQRAMSGSESAVASFDTKSGQLERQIEALETQLGEFANAKLPTQDYIDLSVAEEKAGQKLEHLLNRQERMRATGVKQNSTQWRNLTYDLEQASQKYDQLAAAKSQMEASGNAYTVGVDTSQYTQMETALTAVRARLAEMCDGLSSLPAEGFMQITTEVEQADGKLQKLMAKLEKMEALDTDPTSQAYRSLAYDFEKAVNEANDLHMAIQQLESDGGGQVPVVGTEQYAQMENTLAAANQRLVEMQAAANPTSSAMERIAQGARSVFSWIGKAAKTIGGGMLSGIKAAISGTKKLISHNKKYGKSFNSILSKVKQIAPALLAARGVMGILRKAVSAFMAQNEELTNTLNSCWTSIGNLIGPIITRLVNLVASAVSYLTTFLKMLGLVGSSTSDAISSASGSAEDETKRLTASFDELNVMSDNSSDSGDSTAETLPDQELPDWSQQMIDMLKSGDWAGAAIVLTDQLNSMIDNVDWDNIGSAIGYYLNGALTFLATAIKNFDWYGLGSDLATCVNQIIQNVDWTNLGTILGAKFRILVEGLGGFFATLDWAGLGKAFADALTGVWTSVDWSQAATTLNDGVIGLLTAIRTAVTSFDWAQVGTDLATFINGIDWVGILSELSGSISDIICGALDLLIGLAENLDWSKLGSDLWDGLVGIVTNIDWNGIISKAFELLGAAVGGVATLVVEFCDKLWEALKAGFEDMKETYFSPYMNEMGEMTIEGFFQGILDMLTDIATWIKEHIIDPFVNGFKKAFGIHSPSTVMAEQGGYVIEGLLQGITEAWASIKEFFADALESLKETLSQAWANIKEKASEAWENVSSAVSDAWDSLKSGASEAWSNVSTTVSDAWDSVKSRTTETVETVKTKASEAWTNIKDSASTAWSNVTTTVSGAWESIKSWCSSSGSDVESSSTSTWSAVKSSVAASMENAETVASTAWDYMKSTASNAGTAIKAAVSGDWETVKTTISTQLSNTKTAAATVWDSMKSTATTIGANIKDSASTAWTNVKSSISTQLNNAKTAASSAWDSMKSAASTAGSLIKSAASGDWAAVKSTITTQLNNAKSAASTAWSSIKSTATSTNSSIKSTLSSTWDNIKSTLSTKLSGISSSMSSTFNTLKSNASTWGRHICENLANGIKNAISTVGNAVTSVANKIKSLLGFSEPEDGPLSNFHTYMPDMIDLMTYGIKSNQDKAIGAVSDMASAISEEIQNGEYAMNGEYSVNGAGFEASLGSFSDKIADSFTNLMDRLQAIAQSVTFTTPAILNGAVPYSAATSAERTSGGGSSDNFTEFSSDVDERLADLSYQLKQILAVLKALNLNIDLDALADAITQQQRSKLRNFGGV